MTSWGVRVYFDWQGTEVFDEIGPFDAYFAHLVCVDFAEAPYQFGMTPVRVTKAIVIRWPSQMDRLAYRADEVAALLGVSPSQVRRWGTAGILDARRLGRCVLYTAASVAAIVAGESYHAGRERAQRGQRLPDQERPAEGRARRRRQPARRSPSDAHRVEQGGRAGQAQGWMLGHASIRITADTYSHAVPNLELDAVEKMQRAVG